MLTGTGSYGVLARCNETSSGTQRHSSRSSARSNGAMIPIPRWASGPSKDWKSTAGTSKVRPPGGGTDAGAGRSGPPGVFLGLLTIIRPAHSVSTVTATVTDARTPVLTVFRGDEHPPDMGPIEDVAEVRYTDAAGLSDALRGADALFMYEF